MNLHDALSLKRPAAGSRGWRRLAADEDGAAYTLSYVMVIPVYALLVCLIIETVLMMTAKLGIVYAAYAAARSASVWSSATTWTKTQEKAQFAAVKCMVPFASGTQSLLQSAPMPNVLADGGMYWLAYKAFADDPVSNKYLAAKFGYASRHVKVTIKGPPENWDADITATVTYEFPFNVPGIGRILGRRGTDGGFYYDLTSEATIPNEGPQNENNSNTIGIGYGKFD